MSNLNPKLVVDASGHCSPRKNLPNISIMWSGTIPDAVFMVSEAVTHLSEEMDIPLEVFIEGIRLCDKDAHAAGRTVIDLSHLAKRKDGGV